MTWRNVASESNALLLLTSSVGTSPGRPRVMRNRKERFTLASWELHGICPPSATTKVSCTGSPSGAPSDRLRMPSRALSVWGRSPGWSTSRVNGSWSARSS